MTLPDRLLKTQQVAEAFGVGVSTIKRWVDSGALSASRTVGKHRLIRLSEALRFARRQGLPVAGLTALGGGGQEPSASTDERHREALEGALRGGDLAWAKEVIRSAFDAGMGAAGLADRLIRPVMERVGHGWLVGTLDVYQEHEASQAVAAALIELNTRLGRGLEAPAPLALGATPEGDPYQLSLLLGELALRELGWAVRNLGVSLPLRSLALAVRDYRPRLVFLSVNHLADPDRFRDEYGLFQETAEAHGAAVVLGGRALTPGLRERLVYASFGDRIGHLTEFARRVAPAGASARVPADAPFDAAGARKSHGTEPFSHGEPVESGGRSRDA